MRVQIRPAEGEGGKKLRGRDVEVLLDGKPLRGDARDVSLEMPCNGIVTLVVEYLVDDLHIDLPVDEALAQLTDKESGKSKVGRVRDVDSEVFLAMSHYRAPARSSDGIRVHPTKRDRNGEQCGEPGE